MQPFGIQIVIYLFLAGVAAGAALFGSSALASKASHGFRTGRRGVLLAIACALIGSIFLIFDLTRPSEFLLILSAANAGSAISWGARILTIFILSATFVWATVRTWGEEEIQAGFRGIDMIGLCLLRLAALGLAIYPGFVLLQGETSQLWQNPWIIPLVATSALHSGLAALLLIGRCNDCETKSARTELVLGIAQLVLLLAVFSGAVASTAYVVAVICSLLSIRYLSEKINLSSYRHLLVLVSAFALRYWLISTGQPT